MAPEGSCITSLHVLCPTHSQKMLPCLYYHIIQAAPTEVETKAYTPAVEEIGLAPETPSSAASQSFGGCHPHPHDTLHLNVGASKGCIHTGSRVAARGHQPQRPLYVHCAHLGVRLACPSCDQTFLSWDALRCHKKIHGSDPQ